MYSGSLQQGWDQEFGYGQRYKKVQVVLTTWLKLRTNLTLFPNSKANWSKNPVLKSCFCLQDRFSEHRDYVKQEKVGKATGWHFNKKGHTVHDMVVSILEKVHTSDKLQREERENMYIREFNTKYKGINRLG